MWRAIVVMVVVALDIVGCGADPSTSTTSTSTTSTGGTSAGTTQTCTDTWASFGSGFFSANCTRCHSASSGQQPYLTTQAEVQANRSAVQSAISSGRMPPRATLDAATEAEIVSYLACGAP
jgi:cytochrome c5